MRKLPERLLGLQYRAYDREHGRGRVHVAAKSLTSNRADQLS